MTTLPDLAKFIEALETFNTRLEPLLTHIVTELEDQKRRLDALERAIAPKEIA